MSDPYLELEIEQAMEIWLWVAEQAEECCRSYYQLHGHYPDASRVIEILDFMECHNEAIEETVERIQKAP